MWATEMNTTQSEAHTTACMASTMRDAMVPPLDELLPHRPPMRFITSILQEAEDGLTCAARIPGTCALVSGGSAPAVASIEAAAQAAAAWEALRRWRDPPKIGNAVSFANSLPMVADRAPRLAALDETLNRLELLSADSTQLRNTLRALTVAQQNSVPSETVAALNRLTQRIDTRLGEVHANAQGVQADIAALRTRLDARKSKLLFVFNLLALLSTLMLAWIVYSQVVVIRHHWARVRRER
jgi:hypothetical protein